MARPCTTTTTPSPAGSISCPTPAQGGPRQRAGCKSPELGLLVQAVQTEVIPRLLSVHKNEPCAGRLPTLGDVEQLAGHVLDSDGAAARRLIDTLRADGVGIEAVYLNLLGATARMLGEMWEQDRVNFIDVTVGLCTLHQMLFRLAPERRRRPRSPGGAPSSCPCRGRRTSSAPCSWRAFSAGRAGAPGPRSRPTTRC